METVVFFAPFSGDPTSGEIVAFGQMTEFVAGRDGRPFVTTSVEPAFDLHLTHFVRAGEIVKKSA